MSDILLKKSMLIYINIKKREGWHSTLLKNLGGSQQASLRHVDYVERKAIENLKN